MLNNNIVYKNVCYLFLKRLTIDYSFKTRFVFHFVFIKLLRTLDTFLRNLRDSCES